MDQSQLRPRPSSARLVLDAEETLRPGAGRFGHRLETRSEVRPDVSFPARRLPGAPGPLRRGPGRLRGGPAARCGRPPGMQRRRLVPCDLSRCEVSRRQTRPGACRQGLRGRSGRLTRASTRWRRRTPRRAISRRQFVGRRRPWSWFPPRRSREWSSAWPSTNRTSRIANRWRRQPGNRLIDLDALHHVAAGGVRSVKTSVRAVQQIARRKILRD